MKRNNKKGFTIVELTIVIAVIAILAAVLIPTFSSVVDKANQSADIQLIRQVNTLLHAEDTYGTDLSTKDKALAALAANDIPSEKLKETSSKGNEFRYIPAEKRFVLWSTNDNKILFPEELAKEYANKVPDWDGTSTVQYTVKFHKMGFVEGQYLDNPETLTKSETVGTTLTISELAKSIGGFTYEKAQIGNDVKTEVTIQKNETLVIDLYYKRDRYALTLDKGNNITNVTAVGGYTTSGNKYYYGETVTITATASEGYVWSNSNETTENSAKYTFTMPVNGFTYKAEAASKIIKLTLEPNGGSGNEITVYYKYGQSWLYSDEACSNVYTITAPTRAGYTLDGYCEIEKSNVITIDKLTTLTKNTTLKAKWTANTNTEYKVEYWFVDNDKCENPVKLDEKSFTGTTDSQIPQESLNHPGGTFVKHDGVTTIDGSGNTIVKSYLTRNTFSLTYEWNLCRDFSVGKDSDNKTNQWVDTGYSLDWSQDYEIEIVFKIDSIEDRKYMLLSNFDGNSANNISFEIQEKGKCLQVWIYNKRQPNRLLNIKEDLGTTLENGTFYRFKFHWYASENKYEVSLALADSVAKKTFSHTGVTFDKKTNYPVHKPTFCVGAADHRGGSYGWGAFTVNNFKITTYNHAYGSEVKLLTTTPHNMGNYNHGGWYLGTDKLESNTTMPAKNTTITATWNN